MKKRLLFINGHMNVGGVEKSLLDLLSHIDYDRYEVELLLLEDIGDYADRIPKEVQLRFCDITKTYGSLIGCLSAALRRRDWFTLRLRLCLLFSRFFGDGVLRQTAGLFGLKKQYDCVISYRLGLSMKLAAYVARADRRLIWWHHGEYVRPSDRAHEELRRDFARFDFVVAVSEGCRRMLAEAFDGMAERLTVVPNMVDAAWLREKGRESNPYAVLPAEVPVLASVGRLSPEKHMDNIVPAALWLKAEGQPFHWFVMGDGVQRGQIADAIEAHQMSDCVTLLGNEPNPYPYMAHADVFVHPSYVESQGLVVLEALALGTPCVVTRSLGVCEFICDGENALLVEQGADALAQGVLQLLCDSELAEKLRCDQGETLRRFAPQTVMERFEQLVNGENDV